MTMTFRGKDVQVLKCLCLLPPKPGYVYAKHLTRKYEEDSNSSLCSSLEFQVIVQPQHITAHPAP